MDPLESLVRTAVAHHRAGRYAEAASLYRQALAIAPGLEIARENLPLALLGAGDYAEGFPGYDVRFTRALGRVPKPEPPYPEWRGEPLAGRRILVWPEQGFGDQIMFARFVPALVEQGAEVTLLTQPALARLFQPLPATVVEAKGSVTLPRQDFWILGGSIPGRLGTTLETLPNAPYLPGRPGGRGIGVAWRGDPRNPTNAGRILPDALAERLLALPGAISLHPEDTGARDFQDTAEIIAGLDLVISVCTSVAHLAGAMGKPLFVMLMAENACWRWLSGRQDSPWYPSARLFRQPAPGAWEPVVGAVAAEALARRQTGL